MDPMEPGEALLIFVEASLCPGFGHNIDLRLTAFLIQELARLRFSFLLPNCFAHKVLPDIADHEARVPCRFDGAFLTVEMTGIPVMN